MIINLIPKQADVTRFRDVMEFVVFEASILTIKFTFCLTVQNIQQLETTVLVKCITKSLIKGTY